MASKHRGSIGAKNHNNKLTTDDVRAIRAAYKPGRQPSQQKLAEQFGVAQPTVSLIVRNRIFRWV
jgi:Predicted DNA binding protein